MKILQVVQDFPPNNTAGVEVYTYNLSKRLAKKHKVFIFHRVNDIKKPEYELRLEEFEGLNIFTINNTFKYCYSFEGLYKNDVIADKFRSVLDKVQPDVVHIQHLIFLSVTLIEEIKKRDIPIIFTLHDYWLICPQWHFLKKKTNAICNGEDESECLRCLDYQLNLSKSPKKFYNLFRKIIPKFLIPLFQNVYISIKKPASSSLEVIELVKKRKELIKNMLTEVDYFIAPSEFLKNRFIKYGIPENKIIYSRYGINTELFCEKKQKLDIIRFGFIGTILPAKGLHILIKAFNRIKSDKALLKIYGRLYPYRDFEYYPGYIKRLVRNKNIQFMGGFDNSELEKIFSNIDVLVVPSIWYENSPLTIQEAFLFKTPVITSRIGGIPELVIDRRNGLLFESGNIDDLADKIKLIINNTQLIKKLQPDITGVKSIENNANELEKLYLRIISKVK